MHKQTCFFYSTGLLQLFKVSTELCNKTSMMVYLSRSADFGGACKALLGVDSSDSKPPMHLLRAAGRSFACK